MKSKLLVLATVCAMATLAIMPGAFAAEGDATINISGSGSMSTAGAYANGVHFNTVAGYKLTDFTDSAAIDAASVVAQSTSATATNEGTNMNPGSDYLLVSTSDNESNWTVKVAGAAAGFSNATSSAAYSWTSADLTASQAALSGSVQIHVNPATDAENTARYEEVVTSVNRTPDTCAITTGDITLSDVMLTNSAQTVAAFDATNASDCVSYVVKLLVPMNLVPIQNGFAAGDSATSTITFTFLE